MSNRRHRPLGKATGRKRATRVVSVKPDPIVWKAALEAADGDARRLQFNREDGSVTIVNISRKPDPNATKWVK